MKKGSREKVLIALLEADDGLDADELIGIVEYRDFATFDALLRNLQRNGLIAFRNGRWYHGGRVADSGKKPATKNPARRKYTVHDLELKLKTLDKLADLMETSISNVLSEIRIDLERLCQ